MSDDAPRTRIRLWTVVTLCTAVLLIAAVVGIPALMRASLPVTLPARWAGVGPVSEEFASIRLLDGGIAELVNIPRGSISSETVSSRKQSCLERSVQGELYTGAAKWHGHGEWAFLLEFESSTILVRSGSSSGFLHTPRPDWGAVHFSECGRGTVDDWSLGQIPAY